MFQPKVLKFDGGYLTYNFNKNTVNISSNFEDAFVFTTVDNYNQIVTNLDMYCSGSGFGFESQEEENKWKNPQWINVIITIK